MRLLAHAGAPCPESVKRATMARARPGVVWEFYGSTEAQYTVCSPDDWLEHPGTVGRARPGRRLSIAAARRRPADDAEPDDPPSSVGHHLVRPSRLRPLQLLAQPRATAQAWRGDACTVGDLGRLDADGFLYLTGRRHDLIISGGVNVYPAEVENVLAAVPGVRRSPCSGCPTSSGASGSASPTWPTAPPGAEEALRAAASARLAPYKRPKSYIAARTCPTRPPAS